MLPYDFSRCVGVIHTANETPVLHPLCNDCRRREPGHPERQSFIGPRMEYVDGFQTCCNRIGPRY